MVEQSPSSGSLKASDLGIRGRVHGIDLLKDSADRAVYRVRSAGGSSVLKIFRTIEAAAERQNLELLERAGVRIPVVYGRSDRALLMQDLDDEPWRLASAADVDSSGFGSSVARWYRRLHDAGRAVLDAAGAPPAHLRDEVGTVTIESTRSIGAEPALDQLPSWRRLCDVVSDLTTALRALPQTLVHTDFYWTNVAVPRAGHDADASARVFDYHLLGAGPAVTDVRNVLSSLGPQAARAFREVYGEIDERALALDAPIAAVAALIGARRRPTLPSWARAIVEAVRSRDFEASVDRAVNSLSS